MDFATETPVNTCVDTETLTLIARAVPQVISTDCVDIPHTAPLPTREQNTFPISPLDYEEALRSVDPLHHDSVEPTVLDANKSSGSPATSIHSMDDNTSIIPHCKNGKPGEAVRPPAGYHLCTP
jgi:hypothetical protein